MTKEEIETWRRIRLGLLTTVKLGVSMELGARYNCGYKAYLREQRMKHQPALTVQPQKEKADKK